MEPFELTISALDQSKQRLDKFLVRNLPTMSRSRIAQLIDDGHITINGKVVKSSYAIRLGDIVKVSEPPLEKAPQQASDIDFEVIHEDESIIVVNKPVGLVTHPAPGHKGDTLVNGLLARFPHLSGINGIARPGIVHRIDKDTSGLLVVAKNDVAHRYLAAQLADHSLKRTYIALVKGRIEEEAATIKAPIGRDPQFRQKMAVNTDNGKPAITHFKVIRRFSEYTLLELELETGRTHQIRVHLAYIGHPLVGDVVYGGKDKRYAKGQLLHATRLEMLHPDTKKKVSYRADLPKEFVAVLALLK